MESKIDISVNHALVGVFALGILVGFAGGTIASLDSNNDKKQDRTLTIDNQPVLGQEDANVTIFIFEDYQCPYCKKFEQTALKDIEEDYVESGKVKVVWKDFPVPSLGHDWAEPAAATMECVYRQDNEVFWTIKDKIFDQAKTLTRGQEEFTPENIQPRIIEMATEEGLDGEQIRECAETEEVGQEIMSDRSEGGQIGTPTIFIAKTGETDYKKISGAQPYSIFQNAIEEKLDT